MQNSYKKEEELQKEFPFFIFLVLGNSLYIDWNIVTVQSSSRRSAINRHSRLMLWLESWTTKSLTWLRKCAGLWSTTRFWLMRWRLNISMADLYWHLSNILLTICRANGLGLITSRFPLGIWSTTLVSGDGVVCLSITQPQYQIYPRLSQILFHVELCCFVIRQFCLKLNLQIAKNILETWTNPRNAHRRNSIALHCCFMALIY